MWRTWQQADLVTRMVTGSSHLQPWAGNREGNLGITISFETSEHCWRKCDQVFKFSRWWWPSYSNNHLKYEPKSKPVMAFLSGISCLGSWWRHFANYSSLLSVDPQLVSHWHITTDGECRHIYYIIDKDYKLFSAHSQAQPGLVAHASNPSTKKEEGELPVVHSEILSSKRKMET